MNAARPAGATRSAVESIASGISAIIRAGSRGILDFRWMGGRGDRASVMAEMMATIQFDLKQPAEIALVGVRRAAGFMALGLRAAKDPTFKSLNLDSNFRMEFFPEPMPEPDLSKAKDEFAEWIVGNGFRELEQHFCIYLDQLYEACAWADLTGTVVAVDEAKAAVAARLKPMKNDTNLAGKLRRLSDDFSIVSSCEAHFGTLSAARNVIAHALGVVRERDCLDKNALRVIWRGRDFQLEGRILNGGFEPFQVEGGDTALKMTIVERVRLFPVGTKVSFSPHDLTEICTMFTEETRALSISVQDHIRQRGAKLNAAQSHSGEVV